MKRLPRLPLVILAVLVGGVFAVSGWVQSGGHLMAPLDDTFIHLQYANRLAEGHFFTYAPGVGYSSGATSWLWVFLLTPMFVLGASGVKALALSLALCGVLFLVSGLFLHRLAHELAGPAAGFLIGLLFVLNGHVAWAYLSGMETGLFTALILLALGGWRAWTEEENRGGWRVFLVALALLPLTRPEGWVLWAAAVGVAVVRGVRQPVTRRQILPVAAAGALGLLAAWIHRLKSGEFSTTGMILKGLWAQPGLTFFDKVGYLSDHLWAIAVQFYNNIQPDPLQATWRGQWLRPFVPPFAAVLAVIGGGMGLVSDWKRGRLGTVSLATVWWLAGLLTVAMAAFPFVHNQRYLVPWTPLMLLLAGVGLARLARLFDPHDRTVIWGVGGVWGLLAVAATAWWAVEYGRNASDIFHQHRRMSWIVQEETAPGDRVGLTDAGTIAYYAERPILDLVGLCSSVAEARAFEQGEGSVFERLERMPLGDRPAWVVTYPGWWSKGFPLGTPRATAWLASPSITSGPNLTLYAFDPAPLGSGRFPSRYLGDRGMYLPDDQVPDDPEVLLDARLSAEFWQVVDEVDVADLESETAHGYRRIEVPGQHPADPEAWPRPWNHAGRLQADQAEVPPTASYPDFRKETWSLSRDVPIQEKLFDYYTEHGADLSIGGTGEGAKTLAAGAEALRRLDRITTPTFTDLLEILPPTVPAAPDLYDGGRGIALAEEFTVTLPMEAPALLLWRTDSASTLTLQVAWNGKRLEPWKIPPAAKGRWREAWLALPGNGTEAAGGATEGAGEQSPGGDSGGAVTAGKASVRVDYLPAPLPGEGMPISAHWWLLQPAPPGP